MAGYRWNPELCDCTSSCDLECLEADGLRPDFENCACVPLQPEECRDIQCPHGSELNHFTCECIQKEECGNLYCPESSGVRPDFEKCECVQIENECDIK
jgi:hypothetical protein